jgi:hypothetical protein
MISDINKIKRKKIQRDPENFVNNRAGAKDKIP